VDPESDPELLALAEPDPECIPDPFVINGMTKVFTDTEIPVPFRKKKLKKETTF
jgi:hypothetical protein